MVKILSGKVVASFMNYELSNRASKLREQGIIPTIAIVRVGERPDDISYERGASKRAEKCNVEVKKYALKEDTTQDELLDTIKSINDDGSIHGILLFRPLPKHIDDEVIRNSVKPEKDVDGIGDMSQAGVYLGSDYGFPPCTAEACMKILKYYDIDVYGKNVAVIGRSQVIGKPVSMMLLKENATITICHTKTKDMSAICKDKDIIIAAAGHIGTVTKDFMNEGQVIVDVAINFDDEGNMKGDVDFDAAKEIVSAITPVPGGVGAVTTGVLMEHVIKAAEKTANNVQ